jgi:hypothetical protein
MGWAGDWIVWAIDGVCLVDVGWSGKSWTLLGLDWVWAELGWACVGHELHGAQTGPAWAVQGQAFTGPEIILSGMIRALMAWEYAGLGRVSPRLAWAWSILGLVCPDLVTVWVDLG